MVTSNFIETGCQLRKMDEQLKSLKERARFLEKREKSLGEDVVYMIERALIVEVESNRLQEELQRFNPSTLL